MSDFEKFKSSTPLDLFHPESKFLGNEDSLEFIVEVLNSETPRVINRTIEQFRFKYRAVLERMGYKAEREIRFSDLLILAYIEVRYPFIIDFFVRTIGNLLPKTGNRISEDWLQNDKNEKRKNPINITDEIESTLGIKIPEWDKIIVAKLLAAACFSYIERYKTNYDGRDKIKYYNSSSLPENLNDYLKSKLGSTQNSFTSSYKIYLDHRKNKLGRDLNLESLYEYSRFLRFYAQADKNWKLKLDVVSRIYDLFRLEKVPLEPAKLSDTIAESLIYEVVIQMVEISESSDDNPQTIDALVKYLIDFIKLPQLPNGLKFLFMSQFFNRNRFPDESIHIRLAREFEKIMKTHGQEIKIAVKDYWLELDKDYFNGQKSIYDKEENFIFFLYQSWSGDPSDNLGIQKIRNLAKRDLEKYPKVLEVYWSLLPYNPDIEKLERLMRLDFGEHSTELYMPLDTLIEVSAKAKLSDVELKQKIEFWKDKLKDKSEYDFYLSKRGIKKDNTTLKSALIVQGFI